MISSKVSTQQISTNRFEAEMLRANFYQFFLSFWPITIAEKLHQAWYMRKLCDELQVLSERVFLGQAKEHDLIWNCPPGTTKSTILSVMWQPWIWTRMPSARFISGSYSERLALDLSRKSRDIVTSDKYKSLFPEIQLREDQNTKGYFVNTKGGIRYAVGVGGSVIGMHAHFIGVDDPIDPQAALSDLMLAEANSWMTETLSRRKVNLMVTPTALIMQRLHQDDPSGNWLSRKNRNTVKLCCIPGDTSFDIFPPEWVENYEDGLLDPVRIPRRALEDAFDELGPAAYAGQYGQSPSPKGGSKFQIDKLNYQHNAPMRWKRGPVRFWDKAATKGGGARTAGAKMSVDQYERIWVLDMVLGQWDSGTREERIIKTAQLDGKEVRVGVEQEPGSGGKESAEATVRRLTRMGYRAIMQKATGNKEDRADVFSQYVNLGDVVFLVGEWNKMCVEEMRFFPRSKYKDQVDSMSGGTSMLIKKRTLLGTV